MARLRLCCKLHGLADIAHLLQKDPGFMGVYFLATRTIQTRFLVRVDKQGRFTRVSLLAHHKATLKATKDTNSRSPGQVDKPVFELSHPTVKVKR